MWDKIRKIIFKNSPHSALVGSQRKEFDNPAINYLGIIASTQLDPKNVPMHLDYKLIENTTPTPFITSDNPVVMYDQFFEKRGIPGGIGLKSKGLQIFFPLSPTLYILFYDGNIYKVGSRKHSIVKVNDIKDIDTMNMMQCANACKTLYFNHQIEKFYIEKLYEKAKKFRRREKVSVKEFKLGHLSKHEKSSLIQLFFIPLKMNLSLSFIHETKKAKRYKLGIKR